MADRCIVLLGIGHTNAHVLRQWARSPLPNCRLVCISQYPFSTYSGMLPGALAGQFRPPEMQIQLQPLARRAGAELRLAEVEGLDQATRTLHFRDAAPLSFDALSIGVGSIPAGIQNLQAPSLIPIKPMQTFLDRLQQRLAVVKHRPARPLQVAIVGGGIAGVEIALCLQSHLRHRQEVTGERSAVMRIFTGAEQLAADTPDRTVAKLNRLLHTREIAVHRGVRIGDVSDDKVTSERGEQWSADIVIWATGAAAPPVLSKLGLPTDERGFLAVRPTLQTTADLPIFAVGDAGTECGQPAPKAGVSAVRQAPVLWHNLKAMLAGEAFKTFQPRQDFLKIINSGEGKAVFSYKRACFHARWCWWLKLLIDKRFIKQYQVSESG